MMSEETRSKKRSFVLAISERRQDAGSGRIEGVQLVSLGDDSAREENRVLGLAGHFQRDDLQGEMQEALVSSGDISEQAAGGVGGEVELWRGLIAVDKGHRAGTRPRRGRQNTHQRVGRPELWPHRPPRTAFEFHPHLPVKVVPQNRDLNASLHRPFIRHQLANPSCSCRPF